MTNLRQAAKAVVDRWDTPAWEWRDQGPTADLMADLRTALAQPEQGPVAKLFGTLPVYDTPPAAQPEQVDCPRCGHVCSQREWVGLTDDEILEAAQIDAPDTWLFATAYAIEAKLKERNT